MKNASAVVNSSAAVVLWVLSTSCTKNTARSFLFLTNNIFASLIELQPLLL